MEYQLVNHYFSALAFHIFVVPSFCPYLIMLTELLWREKAANIKPDADVDRCIHEGKRTTT
jgi:hypothetical protein